MKTRRYREWDKLRRERFPDSSHSSYSTEYEGETEGFIRVAGYNDFESWVADPMPPRSSEI